ncbi:MAG: serine/threonine-protein kinase, partial [bacterium]|nr:serine/threonine-protein kinase [bacterium]
MPSADAARRIDLACDQFENSLAAERDPNLQQYLRRFELSLQPILLRELLLLKWEHDAGHGQQISLQHYLQSFPAHQALIVRLAEEHHPNLPFCDWNPKDQFDLGKLPGATASRWMHVGYRIERQLASGGMGRVLLARENDTGRLVALKVLRTDLSLSQRGMERFRAEVQALRRLQHPNIVHVYEINIQHEEPFYTMEYCRAGSLADFLKTQQLTVRESAQLIETLARAVHLAHQKGIVHRDLKPGNVLLQEASLVGRQESGIGRQKLHQVNSGTASFSSRFIPKLADFGLAKDLNSDTLTQTGGLLGSLPYMAPEQVGSNQSIGIGVDVHALGVILYQCLTGKNPFARATTGKTIQTLLAETATTPSRIKPSIPADLSAICTCCLEKNPADRYPSALELAEDLQRFLNYQPTQARPLSAANQLFRWGRRHPQHLAVLLAIGCCLAAFVIGLVRYNGQLRDLNQKLTQSNQQLLEASARAEASELYSRRLQYGSDIRLAGKYFYEGDLKTVYDILSTYVPTAGERDLRGSEWYFLARAARPKGYQIAEVESPLYCVCLSPNHQLIATAGQDAIIRIYDSGSGRLRTEIESGQVEINSLAFSSDSRRLASAGDDGTLCVWGVAAANLLHKLDAHEGSAYSVAFVADTYELISGGNDGRVRHWKDGQFHQTFHDHVKGVEAIAVAPNGEWFVSCGKDGQVYLRNLNGDHLPMQHLTGFGRLTCTDISSDSKFLAFAQDAESKVVSILDVSSMKMVWSRQQPDSISSVAFSPDGTRLLT